MPLNEAITIRPMHAEDTVQMHALHTACVRQVCAKHYSEQQIEAWLSGRSPEGYLRVLEEHDERMFVALLANAVVGFVSWMGIELRTLYVDPAHNGMGIGEALHRACDEDARAAGRRIIRVDSSLNARGFYQRLGYKVVRKTFFLNGGIRIPAVAMRRPPMGTTS